MDNSIPVSRKRRLDLPSGKFNKSNFNEINEESENKSLNFVPFVKSSTVLLGSISDIPETNIDHEVKMNEEASSDVVNNGTVHTIVENEKGKQIFLSR